MGLVSDIKKQAGDKSVKIQDSQSAELEKILNRAFFLEKNVDEEVKFIRQVMTRGQETQERAGLHASALIVKESAFCLRAQVLSLLYKQLQGEQVPVGLKRIFEEGNAVHEKWQRLFIRAGYSTYKDLDRTMFNDEFMISYTPDIICKIPQFYSGRMIGEIKSMNTYQYKDMIKKGGKHPSAYKQCQFYMYLENCKKGFVLVDDKNSQEFQIEVYDYDPSIISDAIERAAEIKYRYDRVLSEGKMVKRPKDADSPACKRCSACAMRDACWNIGMGKVRLTSKKEKEK